MFYIVATPIGNLGDISLRALEVLRAVDIIFCEDTRVSQKLLEHYNIQKPLNSYHQYSSGNKIKQIIQLLKENKDIAYLSDAGTPGISDPVSKLVASIVEEFPQQNIIQSLPGASALTVALSLSGFNTDSFVFLGFLPHKKGKQTILQRIIASPQTIAFLESKYRIIKTLEKLQELGFSSDRKLVICRELTKKFETVYRGNLNQVMADLQQDKVKGEFIIIIDRN